MRCSCCDRLLNDFESTRKSQSTGEYLDMCNKCYSLVQQDVKTDIRNDLMEYDVPDEELTFDEDEGSYPDYMDYDDEN